MKLNFPSISKRQSLVHKKPYLFLPIKCHATSVSSPTTQRHSVIYPLLVKASLTLFPYVSTKISRNYFALCTCSKYFSPILFQIQSNQALILSCDIKQARRFHSILMFPSLPILVRLRLNSFSTLFLTLWEWVLLYFIICKIGVTDKLIIQGICEN